MRGHRTSLTVTWQGMCEEGRGEGRVGLKRCCRISKQRAGKPLKGDYLQEQETQITVCAKCVFV